MTALSNPEAEAAVLGAALIDAKAARLALDALEADAFSDPACRAVFEAIRGVAESGAPADPVLVADEMRRGGNLDRVGGAAGLHSMMEAAPVASLTEYHVAIVKDAAARRRLVAEAEAMRARAADLTKPLDGSPSGSGRVTLTRAADIHPEAVSWLWDNRIPRGSLTLLVGRPGLGKSTLAVDLAAKASTGRLGGEPADVLIATGEDSLSHTMVPRLIAASADLSRVHFLTVRVDGLDGSLTLPDDLPALEAEARRVGAALLIVDPVAAHLSGGIDSYRDHEVRRALSPLHRLAESLGIAVLGIGHLTKGGGGDLLTRIGGSVGFGAAARSVLLFGEPPDSDESSPDRVLIHGKSNLAPLASALAFRVEGRTVTGPDGPIQTSGLDWRGEVAGVTAADVLRARDHEASRHDEAEAWLEDFLADGPRPAAEVQDAAGRAGHSWRTVQRAKADLGVESVRIGGVGAAGAWCWRLPNGPDDDPESSLRPPHTDMAALGSETAEEAAENGEIQGSHYDRQPPESEPLRPPTGEGGDLATLDPGMPACGRCGEPGTAFTVDAEPVCEVHRAEAVVVAGFNGETLGPDAARKVIEAPGVRKVDEALGQVDEIGDPFTPSLFDEVGT